MREKYGALVTLSTDLEGMSNGGSSLVWLLLRKEEGKWYLMIGLGLGQNRGGSKRYSLREVGQRTLDCTVRSLHISLLVQLKSLHHRRLLLQNQLFRERRGDLDELSTLTTRVIRQTANRQQ